MKGYDWFVRSGDMILAVYDMEQFKQGQSFFVLKPHEIKKVTTDKSITNWNSMQRHASDMDIVIDQIHAIDLRKGDYSNELKCNAWKSPTGSDVELGCINGSAVVAFWSEDDGLHFRELVVSLTQLTDALDALKQLKLHLSEN